MPDLEIEGHVARIVSDSELIINRGLINDVGVGMIFEVVDERTQGISDPLTGEPLGGFDRAKATFYITDVDMRIALGKAYRKSLLHFSGTSEPSYRSIIGGDVWPEGVKQGDAVRFTGAKRKSSSGQQEG